MWKKSIQETINLFKVAAGKTAWLTSCVVECVAAILGSPGDATVALQQKRFWLAVNTSVQVLQQHV